MHLPFFGRKREKATREGWLRSSLRIVGGGGGQTPPHSQTAAVRAFSSWVYAAASINANAVAAQPLRLFVRDSAATRSLWSTRTVSSKRKAYLLGDARTQPSRRTMRKAIEIGSDFVEVTDAHPALSLLGDVNPWMAGFDLAYLRTLYLELCGNAYMHAVRDESGRPVELYPMPPQWTAIVPSTERYVGGYTYGRDQSSKIDLSADEVLHFRRPNPANPLYGMGKVEAAWSAISQNAEAHTMDLAVFQNRAIPDYAVIVKSGAQPEELEAFEGKIDERLRGADKRGKFITVTGDVQFQALTTPQKDLAGRAEIVEEIAAVFGVPVSMLKANDPNLASAKAGYAQWREATILPILRLDEDVLNQRLLPMFGIEGDAVLAYDDPVPSDRAADSSERATAVSGGWRTPNEARAEEGYAPLDDEYANTLRRSGPPAPPALTSLASHSAPNSEALRSVGGSEGPRRSLPEPIEGDVVHALPCGCESCSRVKSARRDEGNGLAFYPMGSDRLRIKAKKASFRDVEARAAKRFVSRVNKVFAAAQQAAADAVVAGGASSILDSVGVISASPEFAAQMLAAAKPYMETAVLGGAEAALRAVPGSKDSIFNPKNPEAQAWIRVHAERAGKGVFANLTKRMIAVVGEGMDVGESPAQIAARLTEIGVDPSRATTIARTEGARAYSKGQLDQWKSIGVTRTKWLLAPEPCPICQSLADASEKSGGADIGRAYLGKGDSIEHESGTFTASKEGIHSPPAHPNCRCDLVPVLDD